MRRELALSLSLLAACTTDKMDFPDLGWLPDIPTPPTPPDLSMSPPDLSTPQDMSKVPSCRGEDAPGKTYRLVMNKLLLPGVAGHKPYTYDYAGDGRSVNQLKNLLTTIALAGLDVQAPIDDAVTRGQIINLLSLTSSAVDNSSCVGMSLNQGQLGPVPKFDGTDVFTKVSAVGSPLGGQLASSQFKSVESRNLKPDTESQFDLQLSLGKGLLKLPLRGVHVEGTFQPAGPFWQIQSGALYGAIAKKDIDDKILPAVADQLTTLIRADPTSTTTTAIINIFESKTDPVSVTKCMTASRCCRTSPATCVILPEEVKNSAIGGAFNPDVEVLDDMGKWKPVPGGKNYNAMSVGVGFTAITATY